MMKKRNEIIEKDFRIFSENFVLLSPLQQIMEKNIKIRERMFL